MKKCVIMPDSFKHTMTSIEICEIIARKIIQFYPDCQTIKIPVADGGEGTTDCYIAAVGANRIDLTVSGPYGDPLNVYYARQRDTAVVEMAQAAGLPLVEDRQNPALTTTYGVGEMILHAVNGGCKSIIIGLGGSCTNDAGAGMASALGVRFFDKTGKSFIPTGATLDQVEKIDRSKSVQMLKGCSIVAMCDIDNPMYGPEGAAHVFAPQKGADSDMVQKLDNNLKHIASVIDRDIDIDVSHLPGSGAAGAMGGGVVAFLNGRLESGIQTMLDLVQFDQTVKNADLIITGEGRIDGQSIRGKVVIGIAERASKSNIPVIAVVGDIGPGADLAYSMGVSSIFSTNRRAVPFSEARKTSREDLSATIDSILRFQKIFD
jgi:glycerate kinase